MATSYDAILHLRYANDGASGATEILGATRARIEQNRVVKTQKGGGAVLPEKYHVTAMAPQVIIETESYSEGLGALVPDTTVFHTLVLGYKHSSANRKLTVKFGQLIDVRGSQFPPAEEGGTVQRMELVYGIVGNFDAAADTFAEVFVDATDT